ncbi:MAG: thiol oxidoreductase [Ignavibacteriae bacterium]|nr:thiol oxidoreductase [Ignavibacteriota bacterium]
MNVKHCVALFTFLVFVSLVVGGCDALFTEAPEAGESFDEPLSGLTMQQLAAFARGDEGFGKIFSVTEGLGPIFNQPACETCHPRDGKGNPRTNLIRFGLTTNGMTDPLLEFGGPQLQDRSIPGVSPETLPAHVNAISRRSGPVVFGLGLIEAIPDAEIIQRLDLTDANGDGIIGKVNWVPAASYLGKADSVLYVGRFGRKAGVPFLLQQVVTAYHQDIGITTDYLPVENAHPQSGSSVRDEASDPELPASVVDDVVSYLLTLAPPKRGPITPQVLEGEQVFLNIGCAGCHTPSMTTGTHPIAALSNVEVPLYSDLLLHDMGLELADNFYEGMSTGTEWRTTPLWGLRLVKEFLGGTPYYLHDGRTSSLREVINLHGGEGDGARSAFQGLSASEQEALFKFLESL